MQTSRVELVNKVVACFKDMGAGGQLTAEREKLLTDDCYLEEWTDTIAFDAKRKKKSVWRSVADLLLLKT